MTFFWPRETRKKRCERYACCRGPLRLEFIRGMIAIGFAHVLDREAWAGHTTGPMSRTSSVSLAGILAVVCGAFPTGLADKDHGPVARPTKGEAQADRTPPGYYLDDPLPRKTAYLTFDDGPSDWTADVLKVLKDHNIPATFFICSNWMRGSTRKVNSFKKYRTVLRRMFAEGHVVGNHTMDHRDLARLSPQAIRDQFLGNAYLLQRELGADARPMTLLRPPFGSPWLGRHSAAVRARVNAAIKPLGINILWSRHFDSTDSREWVRGEWYKKGPRIQPNVNWRELRIDTALRAG